MSIPFFDLLLASKAFGGGGSSTPTLIEKSITANGSYSASGDNADGYSSVSVSVPNSYAQADEGKVLQNGALVSQTSTTTSSNGTIDTTTNNSVTVAVPNSYTAQDEGKVVSNGALVAQSSDSVTQNGTVDTTLINSLTVNVSGGTGTAVKLKAIHQDIKSSDMYIIESDGFVYVFGEFKSTSSVPSVYAFSIPISFDISVVGGFIKGVRITNNSSSPVLTDISINKETRKVNFSLSSGTVTVIGKFNKATT